MKLLSANKAFTEMTGFLPQELVGKEPDRLWSDQGGAVSFQKMFRSTLNHRGRWQGEVQCFNKYGRSFPGWLSGVVVLDGFGIVTHYVVIFSDITERKANENALRLAAVVFEQSIEAVIVLDKEERFLSVNRSFTEVTGYPAEEVIGKTPRILKSGRMDKTFYHGMWQHIKQFGFWQGEIWNRRKSGETYPEWLSISTVRDEQEEIINYIGIFSDITERKRQDAHITELAFFDPLTKLPNRSLLRDRLKQLLAVAERNHKNLGVIFIDLNRFKEINDIHGHNVGDAVLVESAARFQASLRHGETLARLGGDEFVVLIETGDNLTLASVAERIQQSLTESPITINDTFFKVRLSAGIAIYPLDGETGDELLKCADIAMYRAKKNGDDYCFYRSEMGIHLNERLLLADRLSIALENDDLQLYYQPQVTLGDGKLIGAEALLRWHDDILGWVSPNRFIPIAEERGMMQAVGALVLRHAIAQLTRWSEAGLILPGRLAINVSAQEFESIDFPNRLKDALILAPMLELELTERSLVRNVEGVLETLHILRAYQFSLSIDDFGTGYSSLSYLSRLPMQKIKIDQSFVANLTADDHNSVILKSIIAIAHSLDIEVIAEGVEEPGQADILLKLGCRFAQGFYYGHPESAEVFERLWLCKN